MATIQSASVSSGVWDVKAWGAVGDGQTDDRQALQSAIDSCSLAGGGIVRLPTGRYLTGTLYLRSGVCVEITHGATLLGSTDRPRYTATALIYAEDADRIAIVGGGTIDGQGAAFYNYTLRSRTPNRPEMLLFVRCTNILVQNITLFQPASWTVELWGCDTATLHGITIVADRYRANTDGIDPVCSRNVHISDCHIDCGDDCVVLKSTERFGPPRPCENITVSGCTLRTTSAALKLGTETWGQFRGITFTNNAIYDTPVGISLTMKDGGVIDGLTILGTTMELLSEKDIYSGHQWPLIASITDYRYDWNTGARVETAGGSIRNVIIGDLVASTSGPTTIAGLASRPIENLLLHDWLVTVRGEPSFRSYGGWYDVYDAHLTRAPAAFMVQHAHDLALRNVRVLWQDARDWSLVSCENAHGLDLDGCVSRQGQVEGERATLRLMDCQDVTIRNGRYARPRGPFLRTAHMGPDARAGFPVQVTHNVLVYGDALCDVDDGATDQARLAAHNMVAQDTT